GLAAEEIDVLLQLHRPAEPGFEGRVVGRDVGAPGAVALFQPQRFQRTIADRPYVERPACLHQRVEDLAGGLYGNVQLPAQLADIGDAQRADRVTGYVDFPDMAERERGMRDVGVRYLCQNVA